MMGSLRSGPPRAGRSAPNRTPQACQHEALAEDAEQQLVEQPEPARRGEVEPLLGDVGALVLNAVALGVDGGRDDGLALVEMPHPADDAQACLERVCVARALLLDGLAVLPDDGLEQHLEGVLQVE
jgi:hypothetical protein